MYSSYESTCWMEAHQDQKVFTAFTSAYISVIAETLPLLERSCVRQDPMLWLGTEICRLTQDRRLSGGNPEGGQEALPALPCPLFPLSDVPPALLHPHPLTPHTLLPWHMGTINHCCDLAERPKLTQHSSSAIKTLFMIF